MNEEILANLEEIMENCETSMQCLANEDYINASFLLGVITNSVGNLKNILKKRENGKCIHSVYINPS